MNKNFSSALNITVNTILRGGDFEKGAIQGFLKGRALCVEEENFRSQMV